MEYVNKNHNTIIEVRYPDNGLHQLCSISTTVIKCQTIILKGRINIWHIQIVLPTF